MEIKTISASSYDNYGWCEWKYFLERELKFQDFSGPAAVIGTISHSVFEVLSKASMHKRSKNSKVWDLEYLWKICFNHHARKNQNAILKLKEDKIRKIKKGVLNTIIGPYTPIRDNTISVEEYFIIKFDEPGFAINRNPDGSIEYLESRGFIDRIDKINDNTIEIIDYKTGTRSGSNNKKKTEEDLVEEIQPRLYHLAARKLFPWAKNVIITFIYLADGGPVSITLCDDDIQETKNRLQKRFRTIKANKDPQRNISWKCKNICNFGPSTGTCDSIWDEKNKFGIQFVKDKYYTLNFKKK
jgi:hypothetical protein